jgi:HAD superfamily hydrolase (TIGR01509 family)
MEIAALIVDFDGLMVDTESPTLTSWQMVDTEYALELRLEDWAPALGTNNGFDPYAHMVKLLNERDPRQAALVAEARAEILARRDVLKHELSADLGLLPGVAELLEAAAAEGMPCAVASSSNRSWVEGWLGRLAVRHYFRAVLTADDVRVTKPAPDLFLLAAARLNLPPAACLVLEDSPNGIHAARAAGCPVVAVPGVVTGQLPIPPADLHLTSLADIDLLRLRTLRTKAWFK